MAKDNAENYLNHDNHDNDQVDINDEDDEVHDANDEDDDDCDEESVKDATPAFQSTYVGGEGFAAQQPVSTHRTISRQLWIFFPLKQAESRRQVLIIQFLQLFIVLILTQFFAILNNRSHELI